MPVKSTSKATDDTTKATSEVLSEKRNAINAYAKEFGASGVFGVAVGVCAKRLTSDALYGAGLAFLSLQTLSYLGYVEVNWKKVESDITRVADQNKDGKLDSKDLKILLDRFLKFSSHGLSHMGGFSSGFFVGLKYFS